MIAVGIKRQLDHLQSQMTELGILSWAYVQFLKTPVLVLSLVRVVLNMDFL